MGEGNENLVYRSPWDFKSSVKSYVMGFPALLPIRKKGVLRIFIALRNQSPWPGLNPQPMGPVVRTLTTTPPKRLISILFGLDM
jgi:hypothetical protein